MMKRVRELCIVFVCLSAIFSTTTIAVQDDQKNTVVLTYTFEPPLIETATYEHYTFDRITMENTANSGTVNTPNLPVRGCTILVPYGKTVDRITITPGEKMYIGSAYTIEPVLQPIPTSQPSQTTQPICDNTIYDSDASYPQSISDTLGVQHLRGYNILILQLHPVEYKPATGRIWYYASITVSITLKDEETRNALFRGTPYDTQEVLSRIDNPSVQETYQNEQPSLLKNDFDLLIITTNALKTGFIRLAEYHNQTGIRTHITTLESIQCTDPPSIRDYIREEYTNHHIKFVLIGGDHDVVPAQLLFFGYYSGEVYGPSDFYYACLDGTFNHDGDEKWGEPHDGERGEDVDLLAEVYIGRACAGNLTEVGNFVDKTIRYMRTNPNDPYLKRVIMAGQYLCGPLEGKPLTCGGDYMEELIGVSTHNGYTTKGFPALSYKIDKLYDVSWLGFNESNPWSTGWPLQELIDRINNGVHIINHLGHSERFYNMKFETYWDTDDIDLLTNTKPCFIYSQGCSAGAFDRDSSQYNPDCIAEYFTTKRPTGAFAGIWNAREGWYQPGGTDSPSQRFHRWFWDAVYHRGYTTMSQANQYSKDMNVYLIQSSQFMRWCCYQLNLFGDPTVAFRGRPVYITLT